MREIYEQRVASRERGMQAESEIYEHAESESENDYEKSWTCELMRTESETFQQRERS